MVVIIERAPSTDQGTFGIMILPGGVYLYTAELPWKDNQPNVSCIPTGTYTAQLTYSPRFGRQLYLVSPVYKRSGIRIHSANFAGDTSKGYRSQLNGCIALGEMLGWMGGQKVLLLSVPAVRRLYSLFKGSPFTMEIKNA